MVSTRLRQLAPRAEKLGYLDADDGYWADLVLAACAFLEERGYALDKVSFHQQGDHITYRGPRGAISFEFFPDADIIGGRARLFGGVLSFDGDVDLLARLRDPGTKPPPTLPLTRQQPERFERHELRESQRDDRCHVRTPPTRHLEAARSACAGGRRSGQPAGRS